jgi:hypothetical protein
MSGYRHLTWRNRAAGPAFGAVAGLVALTGAASAAAAPAVPSRMKPGTNLIFNGNFAKPGPAKHEAPLRPAGSSSISVPRRNRMTRQSVPTTQRASIRRPKAIQTRPISPMRSSMNGLGSMT